MSPGPVLFFLLGVGSALLALSLSTPMRSMFPTGTARRIGGAALVLVPAVIVLIATQENRPEEISQAQSPAPMTPAAIGPGGLKDDADWALITHAYLGGPPPGSTASTQAAGNATERAQVSIGELDAATRRDPQDVDAWLSLGRAHRIAREFSPAAAAYEAALKLDGRNADAWADYADALASANGRSLSGKPAKAIDRALQINPNHMKALWLAASLDLEEHRYAAAVARWQKLRSVLPEGSPDVAIIEANITEARQLAGR